MQRPIRAALATLVCLLVAAACTSGSEPPSVTASTSPTSPSAAPAVTESPASSGAPSELVPEAAREHLDWFLGVTDGAEVSAAEYERRFADAFRAQVPYEQFPAVLDQLQPLAPLTVTAVRSEPPTDLVADATATDGTAVRILIDLASDDRMQGLLVQPAEPPELDDPPSSPEAAADRLGALGTARMAAAAVDGTTCTPTFARVPDEPGPIGSVFKLYVLGALADAITAGDVAWDDELTITADVKSLPSGVLQEREDGSTVTVREAATLMIEISDNTATDLLIRTLGREAVEAAQGAYGHSAPELNIPFLTTRELFLLKVADPETRQRWIDGDTGARRAVLDQLADADIGAVRITSFTGDPLQPDEIEWFASPLDMCHVLATLWERGAEPGLAPLRDILTANPGVPDDEGRWETIAFKGGSEPGVVATAWLMIADDGSRAALTGSVVDPDSAFDQTEALLLLAAARDAMPSE